MTLCFLQYGIKKREEKEAELKKKQEEKMGLGPGGGADSGLNRKKKTPEEIAAEQAEANQDDFTSKCSIKYKLMKMTFCPFSRAKELH